MIYRCKIIHRCKWSIIYHNIYNLHPFASPPEHVRHQRLAQRPRCRGRRQQRQRPGGSWIWPWDTKHLSRVTKKILSLITLHQPPILWNFECDLKGKISSDKRGDGWSVVASLEFTQVDCLNNCCSGPARKHWACGHWKRIYKKELPLPLQPQKLGPSQFLRMSGSGHKKRPTVSKMFFGSALPPPPKQKFWGFVVNYEKGHVGAHFFTKSLSSLTRNYISS